MKIDKKTGFLALRRIIVFCIILIASYNFSIKVVLASVKQYLCPTETAVNVVMIMDKSESMEDGNDPSRLTSAQEAANGFLSQLGENDLSALVSFSDNASLDSALSGVNEDVRPAFANLVAGGATNIKDALRVGNEELSSVRSNPRAIKAMIFLTDGKANLPSGNGVDENEDDINSALEQANIAAGLGYKIFTIGLGDAVNEAMLQSIASNTNAEYYLAEDAGALADILAEIYDEIGFEVCDYGSISGCSYNDENHDAGSMGIDEIEPLLDGREIILFNGVSSTSQFTVDGCYNFTGLNNGIYSLTEVLPDDWMQSFPGIGYDSIEISNNDSMDGMDFASYFQIFSSIKIIVDSMPNDVQIFNFISDLGEFSIFDDGINVASNSMHFLELIPGPYTIEEEIVSGWELANIECVGETDSDIVLDIENYNVSMDLAEGEDIVCTFFNNKIIEDNQDEDDQDENEENNNENHGDAPPPFPHTQGHRNNNLNSDENENNDEKNNNFDGVAVLGIASDYEKILKEKIIEEIKIFQAGNADSFAKSMNQKRSLKNELAVRKKYLPALISDNTGLPQDDVNAYVNFILYGTKSTNYLGAGERAGVLESYKYAFNKLPQSETEWQDLLGIANGILPLEKNKTAEEKAAVQFKKIYKKEPDTINLDDYKIISTIAYGLRFKNRSIEAEIAGIKKFKLIYAYHPASVFDWNIVRAITYL